MRPIFSPSARTSEVSPSAVGTAARAGVASTTVTAAELEPPAVFALLLRVFDKELAEAPEAVSAGVTAAAFISAELEPAPSPFLFPVPCSLFPVSTTAEIGFDVGLLVASTPVSYTHLTLP